MTIAIEDNAPASTEKSAALRLPGIVVAAITSLGAGVIHAGAIGIHAEHATLARLFIATAVFQLGWGLVALLRPSRWLAAVGAAGNALAVGGWLLTRLSGISFIDGLEQREAAQFTDTACAMLGVVAAGLAFSAALIGRRAARPPTLTFPSLMVLAISIPAMLASANHLHDEGAEATTHLHGESTPTASAVIDESVPHDHDGATAGGATTGAATADATSADAPPSGAATDVPVDGSAPETTVHGHDVAAAVAPVPYDPSLPIDLGGVEGVTPQQQARAENLVAINLIRLPQWSDPAVAEAAGFHSIGDGPTGFEHYIQWSWINDDVYLNPDFPESLVYQPQPDGTKVLLSAMFMLPETVPLTEVPDIGGALTQWHVHDNLCFSLDPVAPKVVGITNASGECPSTLQKLAVAPMIHVWIKPHPCGPFAALEGIGAGQIKPGEERLCDVAHGGAGF